MIDNEQILTQMAEDPTRFKQWDTLEWMNRDLRVFHSDSPLKDLKSIASDLIENLEMNTLLFCYAAAIEALDNLDYYCSTHQLQKRGLEGMGEYKNQQQGIRQFRASLIKNFHEMQKVPAESLLTRLIDEIRSTFNKKEYQNLRDLQIRIKNIRDAILS